MSGPRHRAEARAVAARVLDRLADPRSTAADARIPAGSASDGEDLSLWNDLSLSSGFPGVSLAFSGPAHRNAQNAARAHGYLARAMTALAGTRHPPAGIYSGPGALAFATLIAHQATGGYGSALEQLDAYQRRLVRNALPAVTDAPVPTNGEFEVVRGMSGVGRYLLARGDRCTAELEKVLSYLVPMARGEVIHRGRKVPGWWALAAPKLGQEAELPDGHLNLGLSHGVCGPLALLSLAWRAGVVVEGQREAIESIVGLLQEQASEDRYGITWPGYLTLEQWAAGRGRAAAPRRRPSWCYGVPGVSRAIQLAALALDRADWHELTHRSVLALLAAPPETWGVDDPGLCHGWSGLLHLIGLLNAHIGDGRLTRVQDDLAATVLSQFQEDARFGFRFTLTHVPRGADVPAFLEGAAGVALALDAYAEGGTATGWDAALLVA